MNRILQASTRCRKYFSSSLVPSVGTFYIKIFQYLHAKLSPMVGTIKLLRLHVPTMIGLVGFPIILESIELASQTSKFICSRISLTSHQSLKQKYYIDCQQRQRYQQSILCKCLLIFLLQLCYQYLTILSDDGNLCSVWKKF